MEDIRRSNNFHDGDDEGLTARDRMRQVARTILLCADVAEAAGTKGNHGRNPGVDGRTEGGNGGSLSSTREQ